MLHRNGSCSLNRIYSRSFDPLVIFREIKSVYGIISVHLTVATLTDRGAIQQTPEQLGAPTYTSPATCPVARRSHPHVRSIGATSIGFYQ